MGEPAICAEGLSKTYRLGPAAGGYTTLRDGLVKWLHHGARPNPSDELRALEGVSFEIQPGEVVGFVGRNGAGKSTLLKILARITEPSAGRALVRGRLGALLEVGTGFHPELTGRENVFLSGAILGMRRAEIARCFEEIVAFAELERFVETPVKHYSSGMYMRLAFAVAAHLEPEILLVDEVLAVGDAAFQRKCLGKMSEVGQAGRTVLFVSHNLGAIANLCPRTLLLSDGRLAADGPSSEVIAAYLRGMEAASSIGLAERVDRRGSQRVRVLGLQLTDQDGAALSVATSGQAVRLVLHYETIGPGRARGVHASIAVTGAFDQRLFYLSTLAAAQPFAVIPERGALVCDVPRLPLLPGRYQLAVLTSAEDQLADWVQNAAVLDVAEGDFFGTGRLPPERGGQVLVEHRWSMTPD